MKYKIKKVWFFLTFVASLVIIDSRKFYSYKNIMPENNENLDSVIGAADLSAVDIPLSQEVPIASEWDVSLDDLTSAQPDGLDPSKLIGIDIDSQEQPKSLDESVFLDSWENARIQTRPWSDDTENFWKYLRRFFFSSVVILLWVLAIVGLFSFNRYITKASQTTIDPKDQEFVRQFRDKSEKIKNWLGKNNKSNYSTPTTAWDQSLVVSRVNDIINASDIDYIDKKDILSPYVSELIRNAQDKAGQIETIKKDIARQWFLPEELDVILSEDEAIDTIQRSLNALEVIKFSTAAKVFSYMDTAISTIASMVRVPWSSQESIWALLNQISDRWEKDISAYVYMCYLNPFEANANCDTIGDMDLYYGNIISDNSINLRLFKNSMNAINQLLEKEDSALFSITFNWFNAEDRNITFNIEVYTTQSDERSLMAKWKKNPNIFILTNIVNLLKQSSFIIGSEINTKEVNVETRSITLWWLTTFVNYSSKDFTVPIQKDTEREIFDYIDIDSINKLLLKRAGGEPEWNGDITTNDIYMQTDNEIMEEEYEVEDYTSNENITDENMEVNDEYEDSEILNNTETLDNAEELNQETIEDNEEEVLDNQENVEQEYSELVD